MLDYFGEDNTQNCGICDVCLEKNKTNNTNEKIINLLKTEGAQKLNIIITKLNEEPNKVLGAIRLLLDSKAIKTSDYITFEIK